MLRALGQARFTSDGIHFDSIEGQDWINCVFQEQKNQLEAELFDTGALRTEEATKVPAISIFAPPNQERRLRSVPGVPQVMQRSSD